MVERSTRAGCWISTMAQRLALASYNAGPANVERIRRRAAVPETRKYVKTVTRLGPASSRRAPSD